MNKVFYGLVLAAVLSAVVLGFDGGAEGWNHAPIAAVGQAALDSAKSSVDLAIGLVGSITLFLGLMEVVKAAGGLDWMAQVLRPVLVRLFPEVPADHPAMGAIVMNLAANVLGLGNAATPFGLKAMQELQTLNKNPTVASNAMVLFLAINTSGVAVLPTGVIGVRVAAHSLNPASIFPTTLLATSCSTLFAITVAKLLERSPMFRDPDASPALSRDREPWTAFLPFFLGVLGLVATVVAVYIWKDRASALIVPSLILGMLTVGVVRGVPVYEVFVRGAKEGFQMALTIIPYLVAILVAVGMFRASGGLDLLVRAVATVSAPLGLPGEVVPLALLRPLSGSGAFALTADLIKNYGPDSYVGNLASTINGSTETTFYVLSVYFGSVGVQKMRHAVTTGLAADLAGLVGSVVAVRLLIGA